VGPDCTCVKSRMRTPSSALPACPHGFVVGRGRLLLASAVGVAALSFKSFFAGFPAAVLDFEFFRVAIWAPYTSWRGNDAPRVAIASKFECLVSALFHQPLPQWLEHEQSQSHHHEIHDRGQHEYQVPAAGR
jgi:hypothetical protein